MGLDQHFFRYPVPDPLPPMWSQAAQDTVTELLYLRSFHGLRDAILDATGRDKPEDADAFNGVPFTVTRDQLVDALLWLGPTLARDPDGWEWDRHHLTAFLLKHPDDRFVYLASW